MKNSRSLLYAIILLIATLNYSCTISYHSNAQTTLNRTLLANTRLVISLEDKSGFEIQGQNLSNDTLTVKRANNSDIVLPRKKFAFTTAAGSATEFINASKNGLTINLKVSYNQSKIVQKTLTLNN